MKRWLILAILAGLMGLGGALVEGAPRLQAHCAGCCTSPANCPTPACCKK